MNPLKDRDKGLVILSSIETTRNRMIRPLEELLIRLVMLIKALDQEIHEKKQ